MQRVKCQDTTDFDKCLKVIMDQFESCKFKDNLASKSHGIIALCAIQGRLDHVISQINTAYNHSNKMYKIHNSMKGNDRNDKDLYLLSEQSLAWVLQPGEHIIHINSCPTQTCGYVPIFGPLRKVTTRGLKYDVTDQYMQMGGLISTSNSYVSNEVVIETSDTLLWIMNYELNDPIYWTNEYNGANGHW